MQKPWPKHRSVLLRASMRGRKMGWVFRAARGGGTPKRSRGMFPCDWSPLREIDPLVLGGGGRKGGSHRPNAAPPADARAAAPVRLARPATRRFSQTHEV